MRKTSIFLFTAAVAVMAAVTSCDKEKDNDDTIPERKDIVLTRAESEVLEAGTDFSFDLFRNVSKRNDCDNIFMSPLSAHIATCMLANGASGETYSQIVKTLGYEGLSIEDVNSAYKTLVDGLRKVDTFTQLEIANALWVEDKFPVSTSFTKSMTQNYDAYVKNLDFSSSKAVKTINDWCSQKTNKMIPDFLKELSPGTVLILMNALYFNGKWTEKFESTNTANGDFTTLDGKTAQKEFMHISKSFNYAENEDGSIKMCELPYGNQAFVMDIILPDKDINFKSFIGSMTGEQWKNMFTYRRAHKIELSLPKFKLEAEYDLKDALCSMGMPLAYDKQNADLKKMCSDPSWQLWVDRTIQKSVIEVNENGSKAASVTAHVIKGLAFPGPEQIITFNCDHPFMFVIRETTSGAILFMGTLSK